MPADNKSIVRRLYEQVWNRRKPELFDEIIASSHAIHNSNIPGVTIGPAAYKAEFSRFVSAFPDLHFTLEDLIADEDKVVVYWNMTGTHKGEFLGFPATNKQISSDGCTLHYLSDGKIMDSYVCWNAWAAMQQLGVVPAPGEPRRATAR